MHILWLLYGLVIIFEFILFVIHLAIVFVQTVIKLVLIILLCFFYNLFKNKTLFHDLENIIKCYPRDQEQNTVTRNHNTSVIDILTLSCNNS